MTLDEINATIDREIDFIGIKNQEAIKGMLRIKTALNGEDCSKNRQPDKRKYNPKFCMVCGKEFKPHSARVTKCEVCKNA